ncbi:hypothetical protein [Nocardia cyriacigeorgica]|uniref:Uncharacterized protein n=1 Tax=Nocardia cyriacigeorgica (strain GUH-2) TaxID=1127134 RepID=H6R9X8_NOCCG|nr:hypothetical protein [Nocardia cyriacigeorgica]BDT84598.1 hypothetical protein FMUAM8_03620 [Nocardia cyriacigeorgica]CCF61186.1 protein of unknown function [Nocardia cyriacigeorgica GUH-2]
MVDDNNENGPGAVAAAHRANQNRIQSQEDSLHHDNPTAAFRPGDRWRVRSTRERVTVSRVEIVAWIDGLADSHTFAPDDLELIDEAADYAAGVAARIAGDVAASGRTDADLAERLGIDPHEFRRLVDGRLDWTVPRAIRLAHVLGVPWQRWFDDEPPVDRIARRAAEWVPVVRTMREIPDGEHPVSCDDCGRLVAVSPYPVPPLTIHCRDCA